MKKEAGVTLIEMMIVVIIVVIAGLLTVIGAKFLSQLNRQGIQVDIDRQAQVVLNEITREVRVSKRLIAVSSSTLQFSVFDISRGYDALANPDLFDPTRAGTITYQHFPGANGSHLLKTVEFPGRTVNRRLFEKIIIDSVSGDNYLFKIGASSASVEVVLRLAPGYYKDNPRVNKANITIRTMQS